MTAKPSREQLPFYNRFIRLIDDESFTRDIALLRSSEVNILESTYENIEGLEGGTVNADEIPSPLHQVMMKYNLPLVMEDFMQHYVAHDEMDLGKLRNGIYIVDHKSMKASGMIDEDMRKATQEYLDGNISKDIMDDYQSSLRLKRVDLKLEIDELTDIQRLNEDMISYVCNHMTAPAAMWHDSDTVTKIEFQKMITVSGIVFDIKNEKFGTDGLSLFYRLKDNKKDSEESSDSHMVHPS